MIKLAVGHWGWMISDAVFDEAYIGLSGIDFTNHGVSRSSLDFRHSWITQYEIVGDIDFHGYKLSKYWLNVETLW